MKRRSSFWLVLAGPVVLCGCSVAVNRNVALDDGATVHASHHTVNGNITIGANCDVRATGESVNGDITVGPDSRVRTLQTVNGSIDLGERVIVRGHVYSVNGSVCCQPGVRIERGISSVNGKVDLAGATVARDIKTCNADVTLRDKSIVEGSIIVRRHDDHSEHRERLEIRVADGSVVQGDVIVQDPDVDVAVYLTDGGIVQGRIEGAAVFR
jgi:DUF4097 and DUF4098 domain-containing protein YvlB